MATSTDPPPTTPESDSFGPLPSDIRKQRKQQRKRHDKHILLLLDQQESAFIKCNIVQAENECTTLAKEDRSNPQRLAIDAAHQLTTNKQPSFRQRFVNGNTMGSCFKQAVQCLQATKHVSFAPKHTVHIFDTLQPAVMITYDSGAGGHYLSKIDRQQAQLPILRPSTKQVGVANGGSSSGKHVTQLPFEQLSEQATKADSFEDFPHSLMSVGKTADNGTISIFTNDGVTVHKEQDVLITCKGEPILVGVRDEYVRYRIPLHQQKGHWQPCLAKKRVAKKLRKANNVYDLPSTEQAIKWMHAVCGYPVKSTRLKAVKAGNFVSWPLLTEKNVQKHCPLADKMAKGHMNQTCKNVRSTKAKQPFEQANATSLRGKKIQNLYVNIYDVRETIFSDWSVSHPLLAQQQIRHGHGRNR